MSVPLPPPSVNSTLTGRCGQLCAWTEGNPSTFAATSVLPQITNARRELNMINPRPRWDMTIAAHPAYDIVLVYACPACLPAIDRLN